MAVGSELTSAVCLVDEDPMRQSRRAALSLHCPGDAFDVGVLLLRCEQRQVEDDAPEPVADQSVDFIGPRERLGTSDEEHPSKVVEAEMVALDVDHHGRVAEFGDFLGQQPSEVRLAHPGSAGDEHVDLRRRDDNGSPLPIVPMTTCQRVERTRRSPVSSGPRRSSTTPRPSASSSTMSACFMSASTALAICDSVLAGIEKASIVFGVADRDGAVGRHAQVTERFEEP